MNKFTYILNIKYKIPPNFFKIFNFISIKISFGFTDNVNICPLNPQESCGEISGIFTFKFMAFYFIY